MSEIRVIKRHGILMPENDNDAEIIMQMVEGRSYAVKITAPRNYEFHKKYMAMLNILYDRFTPPPVEFKGVPVVKCFDRFREDLLCAIGHCDIVVNLRGEAKAQAKTISFAGCDEVAFAAIYSRTIDYALLKVSGLEDMTRQQIDDWVAQILDFA